MHNGNQARNFNSRPIRSLHIFTAFSLASNWTVVPHVRPTCFMGAVTLGSPYFTRPGPAANFLAHSTVAIQCKKCTLGARVRVLWCPHVGSHTDGDSHDKNEQN